MPDWRIVSAVEPEYTVNVSDVDRAHAETVLDDLRLNKWVPDDLTLEEIVEPRRRFWPWKRKAV